MGISTREMSVFREVQFIRKILCAKLLLTWYKLVFSLQRHDMCFENVNKFCNLYFQLLHPKELMRPLLLFVVIFVKRFIFSFINH